MCLLSHDGDLPFRPHLARADNAMLTPLARDRFSLRYSLLVWTIADVRLLQVDRDQKERQREIAVSTRLC
eukprot:6197954-Pleurochrysis_carterae.AAC.3